MHDTDVDAGYAMEKLVLISAHQCMESSSRASCTSHKDGTSLVPSTSPHVRERGSGVLNDFSCHMGRGSSPI